MKYYFLISAFFMFFYTTTAHSEIIDNNALYMGCLATIKQSPKTAFDKASSWEGLGGGKLARHCKAMALIAMKHYSEGAKRLEEIATKDNFEKDVKASLFSTASSAWLEDNQIKKAFQAINNAIILNSNNYSYYFDKAIILSELKDFTGAIKELDKSLELSKTTKHAEILTLKASALRHLNKTDNALKVLEKAEKENPLFADIYLEKGFIYKIKGEKQKAREAWIKAVELAPESMVAELAKANIERMDLLESK